MYRTINDFKADWKYESEATVKLFKNLTQESLDQRVTPDGRSIRFLAWHLAVTMPEMLGRTGLTIDGPSIESDPPDDLATIIEAYSNAARSVDQAVTAGWDDARLLEKVMMYGEEWTCGATLMALVMHQAHHRGQITVLMRQAGCRPAGIYGPAREDWASMGMAAMP